MNETVIQLVPAAAGWRVVFALEGTLVEDLDAAPQEELLRVVPIACFALIQDEDGERFVRHVTPDDWPSYLWVSSGLRSGDERGRIGYLGPGEDIDDDFLTEARGQIIEHRGRKA